ncbi:ATP-binding cassette domain-containing protein [Clostridium sp. MCC353]|uniref:ABC transporter ATP-binding protein n=1 Tax=Clostridium sp. MCC353 TaxID=2592646 RepID=UPI001C015E4E|nr:ABC transporter ATP-binding protein [Clostridium sp. MCC353]MBT9777346.1 ATP-binding cassette domain-containing protein [Clostridium sp. MCC353]
MSENTKNNMPFLSVKDLVVEYKSDDQIVHAVNGVSINLERGKTVGLVGETGAGKTTIAKSILQILPDIGCRIAGGKIFLDGEDVLAMPEHDLRKIRGNKVSMIFQDPMTALNPVQRVGEQIAEVIRLHNDGKTDCEARAKEMLEIVGIPAERYYEYPHQFSGGMKQRVVIAIALACNPDLLLADEPTTALDVTIQAQVMDLIGDLQKKYNTAMVLITHDMGVVAQVCDDVAVIYAGNIVEYGTKEQIFDHPSHPYTIGLFGAIPDMNEDEIWLHPIEGLPPDPTDLPKGCAFSPRCKYASDECRKEPISVYQTEDGHECRCCRLDEIREQEG